MPYPVPSTARIYIYEDHKGPYLVILLVSIHVIVNYFPVTHSGIIVVDLLVGDGVVLGNYLTLSSLGCKRENM